MNTTADMATRQFLEYLKFEKRYSKNTLSAYASDIFQFYDYLGKTYSINDLPLITQTYIRSWLALLKEQGTTSRSINRKISSLRSFFKFCLRQQIITVLPTTGIATPKVSRRLPVFVKEAELKGLLEAAATGTEDWRSLNGYMLLLLFYATGMRLSELCSLQEKQVDFARSQVKVLGKGNKERFIPLGSEVLQEIEKYISLKRQRFEQPLTALLLTEKGKPLYTKYAYLLVREGLRQAGTLDKHSPHVLRHTFATHLMNHGADLNAVKELLGHASLAATQVYTHNTIEKLKDVHKKAHPRG